MSAPNRGKGKGRRQSSFNQSKFVYGGSSGSKASDTQSSKNETFSQTLLNPVIKPLKKNTQNFVMFLRDSDKRIFNNPNSLSKQYLELDQEIPVLNYKTREFYESILTETRSFKIVHVNKNPGSSRGLTEIQFSKAFIIGVLNFQDWGVNPNKPRFLNLLKLDYNYWDYIDAWSKAFYYQNSYNTHSWWFRFENLSEPTIDFKSLPHWFFNWFHKFGPEQDFLEDKVKPLFENFSKYHPKCKDDAPILNLALLRFMGQYSIPWIFQWSYSVAQANGLYMLMRDLFYKWWNKFEFEDQFKRMVIDIEGYKDYAILVKRDEDAKRQQSLLNQEFKTPSVAQLKGQFPDASPKEIKRKLLEALAAQLDLLGDDEEEDSLNDDMSTKSASVMGDENEDMETRMAPITGKSWAQQVEESGGELEDLGEMVRRQENLDKISKAAKR